MKRTAIPHSSLEPTVIGLGTATFGSIIPADDAMKIMDAYVQGGGNIIDTAHAYAFWLENGDGMSERTIGAWLKSAGGRENIILSTKCAHSDYETGRPRVTESAVRQDLAESLERLGVERIDICWLHRDDPSVPVEDILSWMNALVSEGLVGTFGCSNWTVGRMHAAAECARRDGIAGFCGNQLGYSIARYLPAPQEGGMLYMDDQTHAYHVESGLSVFAYSSQAGGFFSGKYDSLIRDITQECPQHIRDGYVDVENVRRLAAAKAVAREHDANANQVALAALVQNPFPTIALVGPRTVEQVTDSCRAGDLELTGEQISALIATG